MKNLTEKLRLAKNNRERAKIVTEAEAWRDTKFAAMIEDARLVDRLPKIGQSGEVPFYLKAFGRCFVTVINRGESQFLHDLADTLDAMKRPKPPRDYALETLFSMADKFPPGWLKGRRIVRGKIVGGTPGGPLTMRDIKRNVARKDPEFNEDKWPSMKRRIKRYAKESQIPLDKTPGRPPR